MDELIAKLRSQCSKTQNITDSQQSTVNPVASQNDSQILEITTSQSELLPKNRFKLDFDILKKYRGASSIKILELKSSNLLKITESVWALVKSIETFKGINGNVYKWELIDETGVIFASSIVANQEICVGSVICISGFSIWKINGNHLNIIDQNVVKVLN